MAQKATTRIKDRPTTRAAKSAAAKAAATARRETREALQATGKTTRLSGFSAFIREQGVVGLAVGLVIGTQVKMVVDQLVASFINPILGLVLPGKGDLSQKVFTVTLSDRGKTGVFAWGQFVYVLISFVVVAAIIFYIVHGLKLDRIDKKKE